MAVWLVRHGETEWSRAGRHTGTTDVPLAPAGRVQADAIGQWLARELPDPGLVLASPLVRASDTCRLAGYGDRAVQVPELAEWDYGSYEGRTTADIRAERPGWSLWNDGVPGGETAATVARRADLVVARVRSAEGDALVFSHGHLLRVLAARWLGLPPVGGRLLALDAGGVCTLGFERETPVVQRWNVQVGLPT